MLLYWLLLRKGLLPRVLWLLLLNLTLRHETLLLLLLGRRSDSTSIEHGSLLLHWSTRKWVARLKRDRRLRSEGTERISSLHFLLLDHGISRRTTSRRSRKRIRLGRLRHGRRSFVPFAPRESFVT